MQTMNYHKQKILIVVLFLFLPVTFLLVFSYYPAIKLFQFSLTNWDGISKQMDYIGFTNFKFLLHDKQTFMALQNNLAYFVVSIIQTAFALYLAIILNGTMGARNFFKSSIFMPYTLNGVAVVFMFSYIYNYEQGPINVLLRYIGQGDNAIKWLGEGYFSNFSLALIGMWQYTGWAMVLFLGALQSIPNDLFEAADIDGANFLHKIRHIIIPSIKQVIELNLFLSLNGALQAYFQPFIMTKGGPAGRTETFVTKTVKVAFEFQDFGQASAMAVVLMFIVVAILLLQRRFISSEGR